jgi:cytochrome-b5 reductase
LLFANITPRDILLRDELDTLQKRYPDKFKIVYVVDEVPSGEKWDGECLNLFNVALSSPVIVSRLILLNTSLGPTGYITPSLISAHLAPPSLGQRVKIFICGPPGQVSTLAGKKESPKNQGELLGALKEVGYDASQVHKF